MFFACKVWCVADVSSDSPSSEKTNQTSFLTNLIEREVIGTSILPDLTGCNSNLAVTAVMFTRTFY